MGMAEHVALQSYFRRAVTCYGRVLRWWCHVLAVLASLSLLVMIAVTCADVVLRRVWGHPIRGAYDIVVVAGAVTLAAALPYTTAVKGHIAVEYFFHKCGRRGRIILDTFSRLLGVTLFLCLAWQSMRKGMSLRAANQMTATLDIPLFWIPWLIAWCSAMVAAVIIYHLLRPGRELIKP